MIDGKEFKLHFSLPLSTQLAVRHTSFRAISCLPSAEFPHLSLSKHPGSLDARIARLEGKAEALNACTEEELVSLLQLHQEAIEHTQSEIGCGGLFIIQ